MNTKNKPATLTNLQRTLESKNPVTIHHHIQGSICIDDAKLLGFVTKKVMVRFAQSRGWTVIDPISWEIL